MKEIKRFREDLIVDGAIYKHIPTGEEFKISINKGEYKVEFFTNGASITRLYNKTFFVSDVNKYLKHCLD